MRAPIPLMLLLSLLCAGCGSTSPDTASTSSEAPSKKPAASQSAEEWEAVPAKDRKAFLAVLAKADPGLVDGDNQVKRGLRRAVYTCREIERDPKLKGTKLAVYISQRFTGGSGEVSIAEGRKLGPVIVKRICPSL